MEKKNKVDKFVQIWQENSFFFWKKRMILTLKQKFMYMMRWLIDWTELFCSTFRLIDWLIDWTELFCSILWLIDWSIDWLHDMWRF